MQKKQYALYFIVIILFSRISETTENPLKKQFLYAPNREEYVTRDKEKNDKTCVFCSQLQEKNDEKHFILTRFENFFLMLNLYPYQKGHLLLIPNRHVSNLHDLYKTEKIELIKILSEIPNIVKNTLHAEGCNIGINLGKIAGASIPDHLHIHIVPRYENEGRSFLMATAETNIIPYDMHKLYMQLKPHFDSLKNKLEIKRK